MLMTRVKRGTDRLYNWFGQRSFFIFSVILFLLHAMWLALSSNLLPYDEYFHIGIIRYYSHQWSPFITHQDASASYYGDITRLPSYLYHYLMSFPYRLFHVFVHNEAVLTVLLRFINIGLVVGGVVLFRILFKRAGFSSRLVNVASALFLLTPFTVLLAAQNNYDNAMFLLTPVLILLAYRLITKPPELSTLIWLGTVGMIATLTKYDFIVVFAAVALYVAVVLIYRHRSGIFTMLRRSGLASARSTTLAAVAFVIVFGVFVERFGFNAVKYRQVQVDCAKVQPTDVCVQYSPWLRNYTVRNSPPSEELYGNVGSFGVHWVATIMAGLYPIFANVQHDIGTRSDPFGDYVFKPRLSILLVGAYSVLIVGVASVVMEIQAVWRNQLLRLLAWATVVLAAALFAYNYRAYLSLGKPYAIQVRYLLPMMLPILVTIGYSASLFIKNHEVKKYVTIILVTVYLLLGGVVGWVLQADDSWYWPDNSVVLRINHVAQDVLTRIIPH